MRLRVLLVIALAASCGSLAASARAQGSPRVLDLVELQGPIDPPTADYLTAQIDAAERDKSHVLILQLDTPGGLDLSMRSIVRDILEARVPVIVWVAPRGARAASAGTFIAYASHLAYMAEATELGAATPINLGGDGNETLERKVVNDAAAFLRELAIRRDRDVGFAERAVTEAAALGASEAAEAGAVDGVSSTLRNLLETIDGEVVTLAGGEEVRLETWDEAAGAPSVTVRFEDMSLLPRLLHAITDPEIAFLLLLLGAFGLIFELYNPGIGLAGVLGAVALLMAFYALSILPTNWVGVLLVAFAIALLVIDLHVAGLGVLTVGGLVAMGAGGALLFSGTAPALSLSPWAVAAAVVGTMVFFASVMTAALRVRLRRPITGEEALVGTVGEAKTDIAPEGTVATRGTLWRARTMETGIAAGSKVKVMATEGLVLLVEPLHVVEESETGSGQRGQT